jgi:hypothetical protein
MDQLKATLIQEGATTGFRSKLNLYCLTREDARHTSYGDKVPVFQLLDPFRYQSKLLGGIIDVPSPKNPNPFYTDLGSIPWWLWSVFMSPDDYDISYPSVIHDYLYQQKGDLSGQPNLTEKKVDRKTADMVLQEAMASVGAPQWKQDLVYTAVRGFGPKW